MYKKKAQKSFFEESSPSNLSAPFKRHRPSPKAASESRTQKNEVFPPILSFATRSKLDNFKAIAKSAVEARPMSAEQTESDLQQEPQLFAEPRSSQSEDIVHWGVSPVAPISSTQTLSITELFELYQPKQSTDTPIRSRALDPVGDLWSKYDAAAPPLPYLDLSSPASAKSGHENTASIRRTSSLPNWPQSRARKRRKLGDSVCEQAGRGKIRDMVGRVQVALENGLLNLPTLCGSLESELEAGIAFPDVEVGEQGLLSPDSKAAPIGVHPSSDDFGDGLDDNDFIDILPDLPELPQRSVSNPLPLASSANKPLNPSTLSRLNAVEASSTKKALDPSALSRSPSLASESPVCHVSPQKTVADRVLPFSPSGSSNYDIDIDEEELLAATQLTTSLTTASSNLPSAPNTLVTDSSAEANHLLEGLDLSEFSDFEEVCFI